MEGGALLKQSSGDCVQIITNVYAELTPGGRKLADYVIGHPQEVPYLSVFDLSARTKVSEATISRFSQALGFKGFRQFKIAMAERMATYDSVLDLDRHDDDLGRSIGRVLMADIQSIKSTLDALNIDDLRRVGQRIVRSKKTVFCGVGTSGIVCLDASFKFMRINLPVCAHTDTHIAAAEIGFVSREHVVIGVSHSGATQEVVNLLRMAKRNSAFTVGITTYPQAPLAKQCKVVLKTMTRESPLHRVAITSRMSQHAVIDALFVSVVSLIQPEAVRNLEKALVAIEAFR